MSKLSRLITIKLIFIQFCLLFSLRELTSHEGNDNISYWFKCRFICYFILFLITFKENGIAMNREVTQFFLFRIYLHFHKSFIRNAVCAVCDGKTTSRVTLAHCILSEAVYVLKTLCERGEWLINGAEKYMFRNKVV